MRYRTSMQFSHTYNVVPRVIAAVGRGCSAVRASQALVTVQAVFHDTADSCKTSEGDSMTRRRLLILCTAGAGLMTAAACGGHSSTASPPAGPDPAEKPAVAPLAQSPGIVSVTRAPTTPVAAPADAEPEPDAEQSPVPDGLRSLDGYGFQAHLYNQDRPLLVRLTKDAGFDWLKQQVVWLFTEPEQKGAYDWRELDKVVDAVSSAGLKFLISVVGAPSWALGDRDHGPPADPADFRDFLAALSRRYRGNVQAYELWNEANLSREWGYGRLDAGEFVRLLAAGYEGVKLGDPEAIVVGGALTPAGDVDIPDQRIQAIDDVRYLRQMYEYESGVVSDYFDVWGVHPGGFNNAPDQEMGSDRGGGWNGHHSFYFPRFTEHRAVMEEHGDDGKPIWFTEFGWTTENLDPNYGYGKDNSDRDQADFLVRAFELVRSQYAYVTHMFVWNLNFQMVVPPTDEKYPFGVVFSDGSPRPAYTALKTMTKGR